MKTFILNGDHDYVSINFVFDRSERNMADQFQTCTQKRVAAVQTSPLKLLGGVVPPLARTLFKHNGMGLLHH